MAFLVPGSVLPMPLTTSALFDWLAFTPSVVPSAVIDLSTRSRLRPHLRAPKLTETAIEMPWWLQLSPPPQQAWAHSLTPVDHGTPRTELWHTRLGHQEVVNSEPVASESDDPARMVRAIWARDPQFAQYVKAPDPDLTPYLTYLDNDWPFRAALRPRDRLDVVHLSGDWTITEPPAVVGRRAKPTHYVPPPVEVERLALTGLGGTLDSNFVTDLSAAASYKTSLVQWRHLANIGRDAYVKVVNKGWLFPFGIKVVKVKITDRIFVPTNADPNANARGAYLRQRTYIVVTNPVRDYRGSYLLPRNGAAFPFVRLESVTRVTPPLDQNAPAYAPPLPASDVFQIQVNGQPFPFQFKGLDWEGAEHDFTAMAVFVDDTLSHDEASVRQYLDIYNTLAGPYSGADNPSELNGQKVAYAPEKDSDDTRFVTVEMRFQGALPAVQDGGPPADPGLPDDPPDKSAFESRNIPRFYPWLGSTDIVFSELADAGGQSNPQPARLTYFEGYLANGFPTVYTGLGEDVTNHPNQGQVFLSAVPNVAPATVSVGTQHSGGMAAPSLGVGAVSRALGATGDAANNAKGEFHPDQILDDGVKILGGIALITVLKAFYNFITADDDPKAQEQKQKALQMKNERKTDPNRVETTIDWMPDLVTGPAGLNLLARFDGATCKIHAVVVTNLDDPTKSSVDVHGELTKFAVVLFGGQDDAGAGVDTGADPIKYLDITDSAKYAGPSSFIIVPITSLKFQAGTNTKSSVECHTGDISFHGPLEFVAEMAKSMDFGGGSGLKIDVTSDGITITLTIALPDITVGIMSLTNMKIIVALTIPFDGSPVELKFAFCSRDNPFTITVWIFSGGGFVGLTVTTKGVELLEFSFEFGGGFSISFAGLASGKIEIKAGIYFKLETKIINNEETQTLVLEAYFRMDGKVSVLGLINILIHFELKLTYTAVTVNNVTDKKLEGDAEFTVEVKVLIFSGKVTLHAHKVLSASQGGGGLGNSVVEPKAAARSHAAHEPVALPAALPPDPLISFADNYAPSDWDTYCDSFAVVS